MSQPTFKENATSTAKKVLYYFTAIILIVAIAAFCFLYFGVYEKGTISGRVMRIAEKGYVFKTHEGKVNMESFGALKGVNPIAEVFDFSVEKNKQEVIKELTEVSLSGERVNLHFIKRYARFPWRGDTKFFVEEVERIK